MAEHLLVRQHQFEPRSGDLRAHRHGSLIAADYERQHDGGGVFANEHQQRINSTLAIPFMGMVEAIVANDRAHHSNPLSRWVRRCKAGATNNSKGSADRCTMDTARKALRRKDTSKVLIPPSQVLAFTLNGTIPLLYEYRNDNDVLVSIKDGHVHKDSENISAHDHGRWEEGIDFVIGRRYFTTDMLRQSYSDQLILMHENYRNHQATRARYQTQLLLLETIDRLSFFIKGKDVAVFGSLERPDIEVALLTLGGAAKVHSIDYRPIMCNDERIVGYEFYEFWQLVAESIRQDEAGDNSDGEGNSEAVQKSIGMLGRSLVDRTSEVMDNLKLEDLSYVFKESNGGRNNGGFIFHENNKKKNSVGDQKTTQSPNGHQNPNSTSSSRPKVASFESPALPPSRFDLIVAFGSVQHDGLGRYGDVVDPFGDVHAMSEMWSLMPVGGLLLLSVPVANDCLLFNMYRVYGRRRLPLLLHGWEVVSVLGLEDRLSEELYYADSTPSKEHYTLGSIFSGLWGSNKKAKPAISTRTRLIPRWEESQCNGDMRNSPLFVLRKLSSRQFTRKRRREELAKVPGLLGPFPLYHRPR